ncbi:MAG: DsrE family protein [Thioalkalivibrio sp.]|nr:DsrE family protein [Thioalkalivibrio sp.]
MQLKYLLLLLLAMALFPFATLADQPNDAAALEGVERGKVVFDINNSSASSLNLYLAVIRETHDDLVKQGVEPDILLAFRGPAVTLVSTDRERFDLADFDALDQIADHIADLQMLGVQMEGCGVATRLFQIDNQTLLDGIEPVGNTFVSLIGYQARGYAVIPIY